MDHQKSIHHNNADSSGSIKLKNHQHRHVLLTKLGLVHYFNEAVKIQLFISGNEKFIELAKLDLADIRKAELSNEKEQLAWRTNDLRLDRVFEVDQDELKVLLDAKFEDAKRDFGFRTKSHFAKHEASEIESRYGEFFPWFPVLEQWVGFLKDKQGRFTRTSKQLSEAGRKGKRKPNLEDIQRAKKLFRESGITQPTAQKVHGYLVAKDLTRSLAWVKKHIKEITS